MKSSLCHDGIACWKMTVITWKVDLEQQWTNYRKPQKLLMTMKGPSLDILLNSHRIKFKCD